MTANERNVLVALMHPANSVNHRQAGAIRSALAEIDALNEALGAERSRVMNLVSRITGKPGDTTNEAVGEASREALALRSQVATLTDARNELQDLFNICDGERLFLKEQVATLIAERDEALARAIPKAWVATDTQCELHHWNKDDRVETNVFWGQLGIEVVTWKNGESARTKFPTLRDALEAAAKESP